MSRYSFSSKRWYWIMISLQVFVIVAVAGAYSLALTTGKTVWLKTIPYDPGDPFFGNHYNLRYPINMTSFDRWTGTGEPDQGQQVYVMLKAVEGGTDHAVVSVSTEKPDHLSNDEIVTKAQVTNALKYEGLKWKSDRVIVDIPKVDQYTLIKYNQTVCVLEEFNDQKVDVIAVSESCKPTTLKQNQFFEQARVTNYAVEEHAPLDLEFQQTYIPDELVHLDNKNHNQKACLIMDFNSNASNVSDVRSECPAVLKANQYVRLGTTYKEIQLEYGIEQFYISQEMATKKPNASGEAWVETKLTLFGSLLGNRVTFERPIPE